MALVLGLLGPTMAQEGLQGQVVNFTGRGVPYAQIKVLNQAVGTVSNERGQFTLPLAPGRYTLQIQALGYATQVQQYTWQRGANVTIKMQTATQVLDQVLVTAQKTEQAAQEVPAALTVLDKTTIKDAQVWALEDLSAMIPNYYVGEAGVGFSQIQGIRGIQVFSENPALATYIDGVNSMDILADGFVLADIERIEVLRGPQGTLFGRNAMGGVINVVTQRPNNLARGYAEVSVGNLGLQRYGVGYKTPLVQNKLFLGLTGQYQFREGYLEADTTGTPSPLPSTQGARIGDAEAFYGNLWLRWLINRQWDLSLNLKGQIDESNASNYFITQQRDEALENPDRVGLGYVGRHRRDVVNAALSLNYSGPTTHFSSVSTFQQIGLSYANVSWPYFFDGAGSVYSSYNNGELGVRSQPQRVFTQELKVSSAQKDKALQYTAGVFGFWQNAFEPTTNIGSRLLSGPFAGPIFVNLNEGQNWGAAAFGQLTYRPSYFVAFTMGLRYDFERRENTFNDGGLTIDNGVVIAPGNEATETGTYRALSPKLGLTYYVNDKVTAYATYSRGFRAGGINTQFIPGANLSFDPEFSNNYETGIKGLLLNKRLRAQLTTYLITWQDIQFFSQAEAGVFLRDNLGNAESMGLELELSAKLFKGLTLDFAYGAALLAEYRDFSLQGRTATEPLNLDGNRLANTPRSTLFLAPQYSLPLSNKLNLVARMEYRYIGQHYTDVENQLEVEGYGLLNGRLGLRHTNFEWFIWMQNATDQRFIQYGSPSTIDATRPADFRVLMSAPRTFGTTLTAKF